MGSMRRMLLVVSLCFLITSLSLGLTPTTVHAASPNTFHVTLGAANKNNSLMGMAYYPHALTVHRGDVLVFTNSLMEPHTVTFRTSGPLDPFAFEAPRNVSGPGTGVFDNSSILNSGVLFPGGPFGNVFTVTINVGSGTYSFRCALHPLMTGTVTVVSDDKALPFTDQQYQKMAHRAMMEDLARARGIRGASIEAAEDAADIGGLGIEVAVGGGDGVATVMRFFPSHLRIHVGDTVTFVNRDPFTPHTVTFGAEPQGGIPGLVAPANRSLPFSAPTPYNGSFNLNSGFMLSVFPWGNTFSVTFTTAGTFPYICGLHDMMGMKGTVTVTSVSDIES